jgi:hypothetical protein
MIGERVPMRSWVGTFIVLGGLILPAQVMATEADDSKKAAQEMKAEAVKAMATWSDEEKSAQAFGQLAAAWRDATQSWEASAVKWQEALDPKNKKTDAEKQAAQKDAEEKKKGAEARKTALDEAVRKREEAKKDKAQWKTDYNAKHFSIVTGAVVLNPFKIKDADGDPLTPELELDKGSTDANVLVELGLRRRWAWENWQLGAGLEEALQERAEVEMQLAAEERKPKTNEVAIADSSSSATRWIPKSARSGLLTSLTTRSRPGLLRSTPSSIPRSGHSPPLATSSLRATTPSGWGSRSARKTTAVRRRSPAPATSTSRPASAGTGSA